MSQSWINNWNFPVLHAKYCNRVSQSQLCKCQHAAVSNHLCLLTSVSLNPEEDYKQAPVYNRLHLPESKLLRAGFWIEFSASNCSASLNISVCCSGEAVFPRFVDATAFLRLLCGHIWGVNIVFWDQIVQGTGVTNATLHAFHYKTLKHLLWHKSRLTGEDVLRMFAILLAQVFYKQIQGMCKLMIDVGRASRRNSMQIHQRAAANTAMPRGAV